MKKKSLFLFSFFLIIVAFVFYSIFCLYIPVSSKNTEEIRVEIPSGTSTRKIASILKEKNLIRSENYFYLASRIPVLFGRKSAYSLKSGVYMVKPSMSNMQILELLESGRQEYIKTVIPEGLTKTKIAEILEMKGVCSKEDFLQSCYDKNLLLKYEIPGENFEGFLFPDTYFFTPKMSSDDVIEIMVKNFFEKIQEIPQLKDKKNQELYDVVILASIVEREYRVEDEAPLIASVFTNRIEDNVGLYSCATIEYIITEILGRPHPDVITYDDLKIDSPYNTYKWAGLTPGPISNPGFVALKAASFPPKTNYYYFTLTDSSKGTHTFSTSFKSHTSAGVQFKTKKAASN